MKLLFSLLGFLLIFTIPIHAGKLKDEPGKVTVFSEDGQKFTLYLDGVKENTTPQSTVEVTGVKGAVVKVNVIFEDATIPPASKSIMRMAKDCVYGISKDKKGVYTINMKGAGKLGNSSDEVIKTDSAKAVTEPSKETIVVAQPVPETTIAKTSVSDTSGKKIADAGNTAIKPVKEKMNTIAEKYDALPEKTTLATTDTSKSPVMINGRPAVASVTADKRQGTLTMGTTNDKGEGVSVTLDAKKILGVQNTEDNTQYTSNGKIASGTFTFASDDGDKFTLFINNVQQNATAQTSVNVYNVVVLKLPVKIVFENSAIPAIEKKITRMGRDCVYAIRKDKKGEYFLKLTSFSGALATQ